MRKMDLSAKSGFWGVMVLALSFSLSAAFAGDTKPGEGQKPGVPGQTQKPISWEELKERCAHPEQFDVQRAPQNIKVQCSDVTHTWLPAAPGEVSLQGVRHITTGVYSDKFVVSTQESELPVVGKAGSCSRYKEVQQLLTVERSLTCDELLNVKTDLSDYCVSVLDSSKGSSSKLIEQKETGNVIDTCGAQGQQPGKPGPK